MSVSVALNLISLLGEPGVLYVAELPLDFSAFAGVVILLYVGGRVTLVGSVEFVLFFQQCLNFGIILVEPVLVVSGSRAKHLEGSRVNCCL